jgi:hypothetical protein
MPQPTRPWPRALLAALLLGLAAAASASAQVPDWSAVAEVEEVTALTRDADGAERETTIWFAVVDGQGYIRTSRSTTWGDNALREGGLTLRFRGGAEHPVRVELFEDEALLARIAAAFHEKYGTVDTLAGWVRGSGARIMRLVAPSPGAEK